MKRYIILLLICGSCSFACKKTRTCECKNANNTYDAGEVELTRAQAKRYCENLSGGLTECYLKK